MIRKRMAIAMTMMVMTGINLVSSGHKILSTCTIKRQQRLTKLIARILMLQPQYDV